MADSFNKVPAAALQRPREFTVSIPEETVQELRQLGQVSRIGPGTYENSQEDRRFEVTREWLRTGREAWQEFDWRETEKKINAFPKYKMRVQDEVADLDIHFVALFSEKPDAAPLMMLHDWPGSFLEFLGILRRLTGAYTPATIPHHVVVPSLPGYAFSSAPPLDREFRTQDMARILNRLMVQLGFGASGYVVQGGDVSSKIARHLGARHPEARAVHLNYVYMQRPARDVSSAAAAAVQEKEEEGGGLSERERGYQERTVMFVRLGTGYSWEHTTRPATIGLALSASPLALLAWIGEKFLAWTDADPPLADVLESVSLYWLTACFPTSIYPYRERFADDDPEAAEVPPRMERPALGFSSFPLEIAPVPRAWVASLGRLVFYREHDRGGHFAALERPDDLLRDVEDFNAQVWPLGG